MENQWKAWKRTKVQLSLISELATDANILATENWGLNMEICDFINGTEDGLGNNDRAISAEHFRARDAVRAIKKRLHNAMSKNNAVVMYTLTVLETAVKNCDHRFHELVCNKDFVQDLVKLIGPKFDAPQIIQERVLSLIQVNTLESVLKTLLLTLRHGLTLSAEILLLPELSSRTTIWRARELSSRLPIWTPLLQSKLRNA